MADTWEALEQACGQCRNCALAETRLHVVFGDGARDAEILLVGEGPGQREDEQGIPFVGPAGLLLDDMLEIIGLDRTKVYVANIVKCRPPRNRDPLNVEQDACIGWLRRQTALLRPKLIVCLGRIAAKAIIKEEALDNMATREFMANAFVDGGVPESGTEVANLMTKKPSRFAPANSYAEMKARVLDRLKGFFDRFNGLGR